MVDRSTLMATAILTGHTCGEACWAAREDVCRCSCGGVNHGVLRDANGIRPVRTRRVDNHWYELEAVVPGYRAAMDYVRAANDAEGRPFQVSYAIRPSWGPAPVLAICTATKAQVKAWPELTSFRGWDIPHNGECMAQLEKGQPNLIWRLRG